ARPGGAPAHRRRTVRVHRRAIGRADRSRHGRCADRTRRRRGRQGAAPDGNRRAPGVSTSTAAPGVNASRAEWWRIAFLALGAAWWLKKVVYTNPGNKWDSGVYSPAARGWRDGRDPYAPATLPEDLGPDGLNSTSPPFALGVFAPLTRLPLARA